MPQQQRAIRTRQVILSAAAKVFEERGYTAARLGEIIERANVTKGAVYFHFQSKAELALAVMDEQRRFVPPSAPRPSPLQDTIDLTHRVARDLQENVVLRAAVRLVIEQGSFTMPNPSAYLMWVRSLRGLLDAARENGDLRPEVDLDDVADLVVGALTGIQLMDQVLTGRSLFTLKITNLWRYLLPGLTTPERLAALRPEGSLPAEP
ncbi:MULTISPECIES: ScbR family autoregulator-binding transcription factor [Actinomadura]|uniref:TetR family transcriptional regulator n=1 Tax=Actinomadura litoris TaxID=2678616 RepID=A0A7K1KUL3_9ACTN|nr:MULTISPECIES: ScbR family autoregulator-binding transcription factor [Actinomadura]MBT2207464.1 TetR family transcriptional regulator [Actinomadura sp. NEAU-AAG7]MUN35725.1 TetR family transcriptional regulator [Actinomadura litoris]